MFREGLEVVHADRNDDPILVNLLEFYLHDLAEWFKFDQHPSGKYTQSTDQYWADGHSVYLLYAKSIPIGFGLVGPAYEFNQGDGMDMDEFFVVRRHRRTGVGADFATDLWNRYRGPWLVRVFQSNTPALLFWRKTISDFTNSRYEEETVEKNDSPWSYFSFDSTGA